MQEILFEYKMHPTTWVYVSSLITIAVYFKFRRLWSVRNLDLLALIAYSPGLLLVARGQQQLGYVWLFGVGGFFLVRLLLDPVMVRRPLLEPNLSAGGLTFTCLALLMFLMANVVTGKPTEAVTDGVGQEEPVAAVEETPAPFQRIGGGDLKQHGPGYPPFYLLVGFADQAESDPQKPSRPALVRVAAARTTAIVAQLAVVIGLVLIGYRHFNNIRTGVAVALLYLLLPYTAQMTGRVDHVVPAAFLVWAVATYRRPMVAGILVGLAGVIYYPLFLLPLWCGFYWRRGLLRFLFGAAVTLALLVAFLQISPVGLGSFSDQLQRMFGWLNPLEAELAGFWQSQFHVPAFRLPVLAAYLALCGSLALWPAQKDLGTLLSCSAAVMLGTQFWQAYEGGTYMAWYLPLLLLTIFRPNLEDRVALTAVAEGWIRRRKP